MAHLNNFESLDDFVMAKKTLEIPSVSFVPDKGVIYRRTEADEFVCHNGSAEFVNIDAYEAVDLALPSGLKWAACNVGAKSSEEAGLFFQWGSVNGHAANDGYDYNNNYPEASISANLIPEQDAAHVLMGDDWRMPTRDELSELWMNCDNTQISVNGVVGLMFTSKNNGKTLFFPRVKAHNSFDEGIWSSSYDSNYYAFASRYNEPPSAWAYTYRTRGMSIRAVKP